MTNASDNSLRVIAAIDLLDLEWQVARAGGEADRAPARVVELLRLAVAKLGAASESGAVFAAVHLYGPAGMELPTGVEGMVFHPRSVAVDQRCHRCSGPCTHCKGGATAGGGLGRENPMHGDLLQFARDDAFSWAVLVSADVLLIPVVRYLQSRDRQIIHGCFPPIAIDLTKECWASIDLGALLKVSA